MLKIRKSLYWDDFELRAKETVKAIQSGGQPLVRRVAVFVTNRCNFKCSYCNHCLSGETMSQKVFESILEKYGNTAIIHITGGEPSVVSWLYPFIKHNGKSFRFHLNTNAYINPPAEYVRRLKISLDSSDAKYWDWLVGRSGAFAVVLRNIKYAATKTVTSITYTLTKENYRNAPAFAEFLKKEVPSLYAVFFSVYKGVNPKYTLSNDIASDFFSEIIPKLKDILPEESAALLSETVDEKRRLIQGDRFDQSPGICYLSMSERVFSPSGEEFTCSHLYRDGIFMTNPEKCDRCKYGCNQRLVQFNNLVELLKTQP